nr:unnamed protein product [Callosobruchus analis]
MGSWSAFSMGAFVPAESIVFLSRRLHRHKV